MLAYKKAIKQFKLDIDWVSEINIRIILIYYEFLSF